MKNIRETAISILRDIKKSCDEILVQSNQVIPVGISEMAIKASARAEEGIDKLKREFDQQGKPYAK